MKGKIAWLVKGDYRMYEPDAGESEEGTWTVIFREPDRYSYRTVKKVVMFEVEDD